MRQEGVCRGLEEPVSLRQRDDDLHIVDGEEAGLAVDHALVPVLVDPVGEDDDVALLETQLALILRLKVIEGATAWLVQHLRLFPIDCVIDLDICGFERGAVGQAVVLTVVQGLHAAPDGLWFELSLGPAAGCGYPPLQLSTELLQDFTRLPMVL